jgi:formate--tetrahydrofolate ligase
MAALLKDALKPNLVQTLEGNPVIVHCGPFANIAQGTNSIVATKMAMSLSDFTVTEAGFGFDLGGEKFCDIKCSYAGLQPDAIVLVATVKALKYHGGANLKDIKTENLSALRKGFANLQKHIESVRMFGINPVICINRFTDDTSEELETLKNMCTDAGVDSSVCSVWGEGGAGGVELAQKVIKSAEGSQNSFKSLYRWDESVENKITKVCTAVYGAKSVEFGKNARKMLSKINKMGLSNLPVCIAKTQKSLSDNDTLIGRPEGFTVQVRDIELNSGAGFLVVMAGEILRMPGLPKVPSAENIDINDQGEITGIF